MAKTRFKKGRWGRALVAECFQCEAVTTFYKKGIPAMTIAEAEQQIEERGWINTPRGFYCKACLEQDATNMVAAVDALDHPHIVDAAKGSEQTDGVTKPSTETSTFTVIQSTPQGYQAMKRQFQTSVNTEL